MSQIMRAVREEWGAHTDEFIEHEALVELLFRIGGEAHTDTQERIYGDYTAFSFVDGAAALDYIAGTLTPAIAAELLLSSGYDQPPAADVEAIVENMQALAQSWRGSIGSDGELTFYLD